VSRADPGAPAAGRWRLALPPRVVAWALLAALLLPLGLLSRNGAAFLLFPPLALAGLLLPPPAGRPRLVVDRTLLWPLLAFFAWGLVTILWTTVPELALRRWTLALALALLAVAASGAARLATPQERRIVTIALAGGFVVGFLVLLSEHFTDAAIHRWRHADEALSFADALAQANAQLVMLSLAAFALAAVLRGPWRLLPPAAATLLTLLLDHQAGAAGLAAAGLVWALAAWHPLLARRGWTVLLLFILLAWPFIGLVLQAATEPDAAWKPDNLLQREQIWRFGAERALEKPILGWGLSASKNIPNGDEVSLRGEPDRLILSPHPHNVPLLLWLELGLPGVLLGGWLLFALKRRAEAPIAQAMLLYVLVQAMVSAALWPPTWLSRLLCGALLYCLVAPPRPAEPAARR